MHEQTRLLPIPTYSCLHGYTLWFRCVKLFPIIGVYLLIEYASPMLVYFPIKSVGLFVIVYEAVHALRQSSSPSLAALTPSASVAKAMDCSTGVYGE